MNFKRLLKPILVILAILILTLSVSAGDLYSTYGQRIKLTIDHTKIDSDLSWFPVTVHLNSTDHAGIFTELTSDADFDRVAFTTSDESTQIYADCELFDTTNGVAIYHVSKTGWTISSSADTDFYMYYDSTAGHNTTYVSKSGGTAAQSVWDSNFKAVYHMNDPEEPTYTTEYDGSALPTASTPAWSVVVDSGASEGDYASVSGGILTIDTTPTDTNNCRYILTPDIDFNSGFYIKTRLQMVSGHHFRIEFRDGTQNEACYVSIFSTKVEGTWGNTLETVDTTDDYHTYEIYVKNTTMYVYMDGSYIGSDTVYASTGDDYIVFGELYDTRQLKVYIDYLNYALNTYNPREAIIDSTSNANHGTKKAVGEPAEATGLVGKGQDFDGSNDYIHIGTPDMGISTAFTLEAIINTSKTTDSPVILGRDDSAAGHRTFQFKLSEGKLSLIRFDSSHNVVTNLTDDGSIADGANHYVVGKFDNSTGSEILVDAVSQGSDEVTTNNDSDTGSNLYIGARRVTSITDFFDNIIDETRISSTARSAAWIAATNSSLRDTLLTYGAEETGGGETPEEATNVLFIFSNF